MPKITSEYKNEKRVSRNLWNFYHKSPKHEKTLHFCASCEFPIKSYIFADSRRVAAFHPGSQQRGFY